MKATASEILDCGCAPSPHIEISTGYGVTADGRKLCYECCAEMDKQQIESSNPGDKFFAYVSSDGGAITTWPGRVLMKVIYARPFKQWNNLAWRRIDRVAVRAEDHTGARWHGIGSGNGMAIVLKRNK